VLIETRYRWGTTKVQPDAQNAVGAVGAEVKKWSFPKKIEIAL